MFWIECKQKMWKISKWLKFKMVQFISIGIFWYLYSDGSSKGNKDVEMDIYLNDLQEMIPDGA